MQNKNYLNLELKLFYNFFFFNVRSKKKKITIKSLLFLLILLNYFFDDFKLTFKKKKQSKINILNAPYKNKLAQRQYTFVRFYFNLKFLSNQFSYNQNQYFFFIKNVNLFYTLGSFFFYIKSVKTKLLI